MSIGEDMTPAEFADAAQAFARWAHANAQADYHTQAAEAVPLGSRAEATSRAAARNWRSEAASARSVLLTAEGGPELWNLRTDFTYDA